MSENEAPVPAATIPPLNTYAGIKYAYRSGTILPTQEQFEQALLASRQRIADLAVASAVASGESHVKVKLPFPVETVAGAQSSWQIDAEEAKEKRHLSKMIYWYAKMQAGKFHEKHLPAVHNQATSAPEDDYEPEEGEDEDEDSGEE